MRLRERLGQEQIVFGLAVMLCIGFALTLPGFLSGHTILNLVCRVSILGILGIAVALGGHLFLRYAVSGRYLRPVEPMGVTFDIRDPHWNTDAAAQAITALISDKPDVIVVHNPDVQSYARLLKRGATGGTG